MCSCSHVNYGIKRDMCTVAHRYMSTMALKEICALLLIHTLSTVALKEICVQLLIYTLSTMALKEICLKRLTYQPWR